MNVEIVCNDPEFLPAYATPEAAGMDLRAYITQSVVLNPSERLLIQTGISIALPLGFEAQVRPRSGLALKHGITVLNSPGTIDSDYRGPVAVLLINHGEQPFTINRGDRIAQLIVARHETITWQLREKLVQSDRGTGGFGHTGK